MDNFTELETWLNIYYEKRSFEDLFFILLESIEKNQTDSISNYRKLKDSLIKGFWENSNQNYLFYKDKNKHILACIDLLLEINGKNFFTKNTDLFEIETNGGTDILIKHEVNLQTKSYLNFKLDSFCNKQTSNFKSLSLNHTLNQKWMDDFIFDLHKASKDADINIVYKKSNSNLLMFCAAIELGYEPSKKEILNMFDSIWLNMSTRKIYELSFFCTSFAKTNVFKNSLAPAKNIELLLKNFFKDFLVNCDDFDDFHSSYDQVALHKDKIHILYNHPAFLHENIQKQILRKNAQLFLGKSLLNEDEIQFVQEEANKEKPKSRKIKI